MSFIKNPMGLSLRERTLSSDADNEYSTNANKLWIDELPMANIGETSRRVYNRLLKSNKEHIEAKVRATLLESLITPVEHICNLLSHHYLGQSISLTQKQKQIVDLSQAIQLDMAIGFKYIIEDLSNQGNYSNKLLLNAINYTLYYFHFVQIRCYQLYTELPKDLWNEIHLLYQFAENNQLLNSKVTIKKTALSVSNTYKKILLLAATNPNQFRQNDIQILVKAIDYFIRYCDIGPLSDTNNDVTLVVKLSSDSAPFRSSLIKDDIHSKYRGINTQNIIKLLEQELVQPSHKFDLKPVIIKDLIQSWGKTGSRTFTRIESTGEMQVTIGLAGSHYIINKERYGEDPLSTLIFDLEDSKTAYQFMKYATTNSSEPTYDYQSATIINLSPGSYCLKLVGMLPKHTQTGEIIGLMETTKNGVHKWNIGNIRWMKKNDDGDLNLGVQLIGPNADPVLAQVLTKKMKVTENIDESAFQRCLFLPELLGIGQPATILTSTVPFSVNHQLHIRSYDGDYNIQLTKIISEGHSYKQFEYEILGSNTPIKKVKETTANFDSLWELI